MVNGKNEGKEYFTASFTFPHQDKDQPTYAGVN
jgi:hypothetical protein